MSLAFYGGDLMGPGYRFTATITKGTKKMVLTGTATSEISVQGVRINPANVEWDSSLYRGPAFHELDPDLQVRDFNEHRPRFCVSCFFLLRFLSCGPLVLLVFPAHSLCMQIECVR